MNDLHQQYYIRTLQKKVLETSQSFSVVLITGPRQVGKTTLFLQCMELEKSLKRSYISLDDMKVRHLAKTDPELFLQTYRFPILIDEVQYAPELFPYIKIMCDREQKSGLFWLTGSQQFSMMHHISESLAGRVGILQLQGLSQSEISFTPDIAPFIIPESLPISGENDTEEKTDYSLKTLYARFLRGSYPALYSRPQTDTETFYSSYIQTYLERDVRSLLRVKEQHSFFECMRVLASRTGQLLNYNDVSRDIGVSVNTVKSWVSILETSGVVYLLQPWSSNLTNRAIKTPKLYFLDTGLCCFLTGWKTAETLMDGIMNGSIFETYVVSEVLKSWIHNGKIPPLYFYRDKEKHEIDILMEYEGLVHPVEIKKTANPDLSMTKGFRSLEKTGVKMGKGAVICLYPSYLPLSRSIFSVPLWNPFTVSAH
ncbi:MAG TPA: ATP-binding protein [Treponemataceae bacterium]|nr:ATP-binding protein [Treponemataceae bacterium]HQL04406.1 ATP-binding protein [Treponemataceae bacterium]